MLKRIRVRFRDKVFETFIPENTDEEHEFSTYLHYVESISGLIRDRWLEPVDLLRAPEVTAALGRSKPNDGSDPKAVRNFLVNSWSTELSLRVARLVGDGAIRYFNHWAPVQAYYAVYLGLQALYASNGTRASTHSSALRTASNNIKQGRLGVPPPWFVVCDCERDVGRAGYPGLPAGAELTKISTLAPAVPDRWWSFYTLALRTTRQRILTARCQEWKKQHKKKRIPR